MGGQLDDLKAMITALGATFMDFTSEIPEFVEAMALQTEAFGKAKSALLDLDVANADYLTGLERAIAFNQRATKSFLEVNKAALHFEKRNASLQKGLNLTRQQAAGVAQELAKSANVLALASENVNKYAGNIKKLIPFMDVAGNANSLFYQGLLATQDVITTNMGLSAEQAENYSLFAGQTGNNAGIALKTTSKLSTQLENQYNIQGAQQDIVEGISEATATTALQYGRIPGTIELAVLKSKQLGLTLNDLAGTGKNLLDIESSIGKELEYQLLSGRRLTIEGGKSLTNEYRMATLKGDANRQADLMNKLLEEEGETLENNMLAREQMASMLGMSEDALSKSLQKQKLIQQLGAQGKILFAMEGEKDFLTAAQRMADAGDITQDELKQIAELGDKRSTEDILEEQLRVLEDIRLQDFLQSEQGEALGDMFDTLGTEFADYQNELFDITQDMSETEIKKLGGILRKGTAISDITNVKDYLISSKAEVTGDTKTVDDLLYIPGMGTSTSGFGEMFELNPNDAVAAGPAPAIAAMTNGGGSIDMNAFANIIVSALKGASFTVDPGPLATHFSQPS